MLEKILRDNRYMTVSTVDQDGMPWAAPVWYAHDNNGNFYWWSPIESQHSRNIKNNSNVYLTIFNSKAAEGDGLGLYIQATATELPKEELDAIIELYNSTTSIFKMSRLNCSGDAPTRLYKAIPSKIWHNDGLERDEHYTDIRKAL